MADKKISELNLHTSPELSDSFATVNGGETKKVLLGALNETIRNSNTPLTASGITVSGDIVPTTPQGATLGTIDRPFADLFLQSGSISIESDVPGDPSAVISNINGNLEISVGGMRLIQPDASFIAPTGSFSYLSSSFNHIGSAFRVGDTIITGSVDITGSFEADLQENYVWLGDSNNRSIPVELTSLLITGPSGSQGPQGIQGETGSQGPAGETPDTGSFVQSAYMSCFSSSSISLATSGSEQVIPFTSIWTQNGISLVDNTKFTFAEPGVYKLEFLTTIENDTNDEQDSWFWIKLNGTNFPNSSTKVTVRKQKSNGQHTHQLVSISILGVAQTAGDYVQLYWTGEDTALGMPYEGATGVHPATPSVILNIIRVG